MPMQMGFRWYGEGNDKISLSDIKQIPGVSTIVWALHDKMPGEVWQQEEIEKAVGQIRAAGFNADVVESVNVHDDIKIGLPTRDKYIDNYIQTIRNLAPFGVVKTDPVHYEAIATPVSTSIPQIRRDFTSRFTNGQRYLDAAGRKFDQPTHYARKIMLLGDLYEDSTLDRFIGYCIDVDKMDITSFKGILRDYNAGKLPLPEPVSEDTQSGRGMDYRDDDPALTRDCSYYEANAMAEVHG